MKNLIIKGLTTFFLAFITVSIITLPANAASDPRFFGTYCGNYEETHIIRYRVWFFGWRTVREERRTLRFSVTSQADYRESPRGNGLVTGTGTAVGEGRTIPLVFSGIVTERGYLRGSGLATGFEPSTATATISGDGNTITIRGMDRRIVLRKDQCGSSAPSVRILSPETGADLRWGQHITFRGNATDTEDAAFPEERLVWTSSRDGRIGTGLSTFSSRLTPGSHTITFSGTDSGGQTATASIEIQVTNNRPNPPRISEPIEGAAFYAGQEIAFRAWATDPEDGYLSGSSLVWSSNRDGSIGTDDLLRRPLSEGNHTITLTAADRAGLSSAASVRITVRPRPAGNTPPTVTIVSPGNYYAFADYDCITFVAESSDLEDGRLMGDSLAWRDQYDGGPVGGRELGTGERIDICNLPAPVADTRHVVSVTSTDSGGRSTTNSIVVIVIPGGLI